MTCCCVSYPINVFVCLCFVFDKTNILDVSCFQAALLHVSYLPNIRAGSNFDNVMSGEGNPLLYMCVLRRVNYSICFHVFVLVGADFFFGGSDRKKCKNDRKLHKLHPKD